jgi:hypothetical protein
MFLRISLRRSRAGLAGFRGAVVLCLACLAAFPTSAFADEPAPEKQPPIPLRTGSFLTPAEMAGTGLTPEVALRARIDARGRVGDVEILGIVPSSEYDDLLRRITIETVERWRYAPARVDGEPVEATLEWTVQFKTRGATGVTPEPDWMRLGLGPWDDLPATRMLTLPVAKQEEYLRRYAGLAERQLVAGRRRQFDTSRFVVVSDAEEPRVAEIAAGNLEATFNVLDGLFRPGIEPQPAHYKSLVYVFSERRALDALTAAIRTPEWADGLYSAPGFLVFHLEQQSPEAAMAAMLHEAVHAYTDRHLLRPGYAPPVWLAEGLAEYMASSRIRRGELIPGRTLTRKLELNRRTGGAFRVKTRAGWSLDEVKKAVRAGEAPGLAELLTADRIAFYGEDFALYYSLSWLFIHYLRHGEPGWAEREFPALVLYLVEGFPSAVAIEAVYGVPPAAMDAAFRTYVQRFG